MLKFIMYFLSIAHRAGVTYATSTLGRSVLFGGAGSFIAGLGTTFRTGAAHALEPNAVLKPVTALHVYIGRPFPFRGAIPPVSVSTQIAVLRRLLLNAVKDEEETGYWFRKAADVRTRVFTMARVLADIVHFRLQGSIPLIIETGSADIMATLLKLKADLEDQRGTRMRMVFLDATEAHLLAEEIGKCRYMNSFCLSSKPQCYGCVNPIMVLAQAKVGVILKPVRPFPANWDNRRMYVSLIVMLLSGNLNKMHYH